MKIMKPFYLKYPNIDESIFYQLNEQCNMLTETYHQLTKFDVCIRHIVNHIIKNFNHLEDFYTGYVWDSLKNSCYGFKNEQSLENKINLNDCLENSILFDYPRGVEKITKEQFDKILEIGNVDNSIII